MLRAVELLSLPYSRLESAVHCFELTREPREGLAPIALHLGQLRVQQLLPLANPLLQLGNFFKALFSESVQVKTVLLVQGV